MQDNDTALTQLAHQLNEWRRTHKAPSKIPDEVWTGAVTLAGRLGISRVSQALQLNHSALKKRVGSSTPAIHAEPTFVEWLPGFSGHITECSVELHSMRGAKVKVEMKGVPGSALATVLRELMA